MSARVILVVCITCQRDLPRGQFGKTPRRLNGLDPRCRECIREQAKACIRFNYSLPRYEALMRDWPDRQLDSEIEFLLMKLELLRTEKARRRPARRA